MRPDISQPTGSTMEVRIGVIHTGKELRLELEPATTVDDVVSAVEAAMSGSTPVLWLTDKDGDRHAISSDKIAWVDVAAGQATKRVGFGPA
jgi:hypothetical protein